VYFKTVLVGALIELVSQDVTVIRVWRSRFCKVSQMKRKPELVIAEKILRYGTSIF
jgi:hypothetical protein